MAVFHRLFLTTVVLVGPAVAVCGQEVSPGGLTAEEQTVPAEEQKVLEDSAAHSQQGGRIVERRPPFYSFKQAIHPLTWLGAAPKPVFRSVANGRLNWLLPQKSGSEKISGISFGLGSVGPNSGYGPLVTLYHKDFLGRGIDLELPLVYTYARYDLYQFTATVPLASETFVKRLAFDFGTSYSSRSSDSFFGIGNDTPREDEVQVRTVSREATVGVSAKLNDNWNTGIHVRYRRVGVTSPLTGTSAQKEFAGLAVPGLFTGGDLASLVFSVARNTESPENNSFQGGGDEFEISFNEGRDSFGYWRYRFNSRHFFPVSDDGRKVIAARGFLETNRTLPGHSIPFFDMPTIGSVSTVRGYENFRFRDNSALAFSLEYRYRIWPWMDWGLFLDEGQVAPRLGDFGLSRFHTGYGARLFFWPKPNLPISVDLGRSRESWLLYLNVNPKF